MENVAGSSKVSRAPLPATFSMQMFFGVLRIQIIIKSHYLMPGASILGIFIGPSNLM